MRRTLGFLVLVGCAHNVPQDRATGNDGKLKGATPIAVIDGEAKVKGIVTYPGGDRVDWKLIELPVGKRGKLDLQLTWRTPRPGLQVAFDVFDQYSTPIVATKAAQRKGGRTRTATINDAVGKYFVRVYAPKRGDAGAYTLVARFDEVEQQEPVDERLRKLPIPDPPKLAAIPPAPLSCDVFDPSNPSCPTACPDDAPAGWKGCKDRDDKSKREADAAAIAAARADCQKNQPKSFTTRIIHVEVNGDVVNVKLDTGTDEQPVGTGWTARVLVNGTDKPIANGSVKLINVGKQQTKGSSGLTTDQLTANPWVRLTPPAPNCP